MQSEQFRLLIWAKWQSYRNALRKSGVKRAKLLTAIVTYVVAGVGALGSGAAFLGMGAASAAREKVELLGIGLFLTFALWQLAPLIFEATTPTIKFRDVARYPVAFRTFYALHVTYGLIDPAVALGIVWLLAMWIGMLFGRIEWALRAILPFTFFAAANLLANRFLLTLLDRLAATRRGRERVFGAFLLLLIVLQLGFYWVMPRAGSTGMKALGRALLPVWTWSPPGLASWNVVASGAKFVTGLGVLALYCLICAALLRWQLAGVFAGQIYSESQRRSGAVQTRAGWSLPFVSERTAAIVEKEIRYHLRDTRTMINLAMPAIFALMIGVSQGAAARTVAVGLKIQSNSSRMQITFTLAAVFLLAYTAYNSFGFEGEGFQRWSLIPARAREVLVGKNLAVCLLWAISIILVNVVVAASGGYSFKALGFAVPAAVYTGLAVLAAGNQFSVRMPLKIEYGSITSKAISEGVVLGSVVLFATVGGSMWGVYVLSRRMQQDWVLPAGCAVLACIAAATYIVSLRNAAHYLETHVEQMAEELE